MAWVAGAYLAAIQVVQWKGTDIISDATSPTEYGNIINHTSASKGTIIAMIPPASCAVKESSHDNVSSNRQDGDVNSQAVAHNCVNAHGTFGCHIESGGRAQDEPHLLAQHAAQILDRNFDRAYNGPHTRAPPIVQIIQGVSSKEGSSLFAGINTSPEPGKDNTSTSIFRQFRS